MLVFSRIIIFKLHHVSILNKNRYKCKYKKFYNSYSQTLLGPAALAAATRNLALRYRTYQRSNMR